MGTVDAPSLPWFAFGIYEVVFILIFGLFSLLFFIMQLLMKRRGKLPHFIILIFAIGLYLSTTWVRYANNPSHRLLGYGTFAFSSKSYLKTLEYDLKAKLIGKSSSEAYYIINNLGAIKCSVYVTSKKRYTCFTKDSFYFIARESWAINFPAESAALNAEDIFVEIFGGARI